MAVNSLVGPETMSLLTSLDPVTVIVTSVYEPKTTTLDLQTAATTTFISTLEALALTTIFTAPESCSTRPFTINRSNQQNVGIWDVGSTYTGSCYPPNWATAKSQYYVPGVCPSAYQIGRLLFFETVTSLACCPQYISPFLCLQTLLLRDTMMLLTYSANLTVPDTNVFGTRRGMSFLDSMCQTVISTSTVAAMMLSGQSTTAITEFPFTGMATPVNVAWESSNLAYFTPSGAPASLVLAQLTASPSVKVPLTTGVKAGIAVGVVLGLIISLVVAIFFWRRRKRQLQKPEVAQDVGVESKVELSGETASGKLPREMDATNGINEMQDPHSMPEIESRSPIKAELEGHMAVHELP